MAVEGGKPEYFDGSARSCMNSFRIQVVMVDQNRVPSVNTLRGA